MWDEVPRDCLEISIITMVNMCILSWNEHNCSAEIQRREYTDGRVGWITHVQLENTINGDGYQEELCAVVYT